MVDGQRLTKVSKHLPLLVELRQADEGLRQSEIRERLDWSKSTAHRKIKKLVEMDLVSRVDTKYKLTGLGEIVTENVSRCASNVETAYEYDEFLETVRRSDLCLEHIDGGSVTHASKTNPMATLVRLAEVTAESDRVRVLTNSVAPRSFDVGREGIRNGEKEIKMVLDSHTVESVQETEWYGKELEKDLETGNLEIWIHEDVPYQIGIFDGKLCLGAEDDEGRPTAMVETTNGDAVSWATETFESYKLEAERLLASEI